MKLLETVEFPSYCLKQELGIESCELHFFHQRELFSFVPHVN